jgi:hypothetical protein
VFGSEFAARSASSRRSRLDARAAWPLRGYVAAPAHGAQPTNASDSSTGDSDRDHRCLQSRHATCGRGQLLVGLRLYRSLRS